MSLVDSCKRFNTGLETMPGTVLDDTLSSETEIVTEDGYVRKSPEQKPLIIDPYYKRKRLLKIILIAAAILIIAGLFFYMETEGIFNKLLLR